MWNFRIDAIYMYVYGCDHMQIWYVNRMVWAEGVQMTPGKFDLSNILHININLFSFLFRFFCLSAAAYVPFLHWMYVCYINITKKLKIIVKNRWDIMIC